MSFIIKSKQLSLVSALLATTALTACGDSDSSPTAQATPTPVVTMTPMPMVTMTPYPKSNYAYEVEVTNLTHAQMMSPIAVGLHYEGSVFTVGQPASKALEVLAEGGDNSQLLADEMWASSMSGEGGLMPGATQQLTIQTDDMMAMKLSLTTMLVNTNDAFTGINALSVKDLMVGESISLKTRSYDAGTEFNSELKATIPGPAGGGEGYNSERDDVNDIVTMHPGVVSYDDGLMTSELSQAYRFDNPTLSISITRVE